MLSSSVGVEGKLRTFELQESHRREVDANGTISVKMKNMIGGGSFHSLIITRPMHQKFLGTDGRIFPPLQVKGIPTLIVLDAEGNLVSKDGRSSVMQDPTGKSWIPNTKSASVDGDAGAAADTSNKRGGFFGCIFGGLRKS